MDDDEAAVAAAAVAADDDDDVHDYYDDGLHCSFAAFVWYSFSGFLLHIIQSTNSKYELNSQEPSAWMMRWRKKAAAAVHKRRMGNPFGFICSIFFLIYFCGVAWMTVGLAAATAAFVVFWLCARCRM